MVNLLLMQVTMAALLLDLFGRKTMRFMRIINFSKTLVSGLRLWHSLPTVLTLLLVLTITISMYIGQAIGGFRESAQDTLPTSWLSIGARTRNSSARTVVPTSYFSSKYRLASRTPQAVQT